MGVLTELLSWLILIVLLSWVDAVFWSGTKDRIRKLLPSIQIHTMMVLVSTPVIISTLTLWFYQFPVFSDILVDSHCHGGNCRPHDLYLPASNAFSYMLLLAGALVLGIFLLIGIRTIRLSAHYTRTLKSFSHYSSEALYRVVESEQQNAWCAGYFSPKVYVTSGLVNRASEAELQLIVLHELNHVRRLDNLKRVVARLLMNCWPASVRKAFLSQLGNALEIRCDYYAMKTAGVTDVEALPVNLCVREAADTLRSNERKAILATLLSMANSSVFSCGVIYLGILVWLLGHFLLTVKLAHPLLEFLLR